ncbi:MFS transporter [Streptococcus devriesei]|uniref:MFS transporter n=1 Tax=Streptococcus devriesei TaxID=231233 RepID=UPI0004833D1F|nr:MFS transporter [Streptococcus devriesei]
MEKKNYIFLIVSLYLNYFFQGIASIVISQNLTIFQNQWGASLSQVTLVISAIGLGRILTLNLAGWFSDYFSRKLTVLVGVAADMLFFVGMVFTNNYFIAFIVALLAGVGNAFLDTSTYPIVVESFPSESDNGSLSVLNKAFISTGQFVLPIVVRWTLRNKIYFGWVFFICDIGLLLNLILLMQLSYPEKQNSRPKSKKTLSEKTAVRPKKAKLHIEGLALMIFSFVSVSLFNIFVFWIPTFAERVLSINKADSLLFVSIYSICSFVSVFATSVIVKKKVNISNLILVCLGLTSLSILYMIWLPSLFSIILASSFVGLFAAGGIWQLGLALLLEFFPMNKGIVTSFYSLSTALSVMSTPYITGLMVEQSVYLAFIYNFILAVIGFLAMFIVKRRYQQLFKR